MKWSYTYFQTTILRTIVVANITLKWLPLFMQMELIGWVFQVSLERRALVKNVTLTWVFSFMYWFNESFHVAIFQYKASVRHELLQYESSSCILLRNTLYKYRIAIWVSFLCVLFYNTGFLKKLFLCGLCSCFRQMFNSELFLTLIHIILSELLVCSVKFWITASFECKYNNFNVVCM